MLFVVAIRMYLCCISNEVDMLRAGSESSGVDRFQR